MNFNFLITFGIGIGVYLVGLGIFVLIKYLRNKKKFEKDMKDHNDKPNEE